MDGLINLLAGELTRTVTDPYGSGWRNPSGEESADLCSWHFGDTRKDTDSRGTSYEYNLVGVGGSRFLVQLNYDIVSQSCRLQDGDASPVPAPGRPPSPSPPPRRTPPTGSQRLPPSPSPSPPPSPVPFPRPPATGGRGGIPFIIG